MECRQAYFYLNIRGRAADELGPETNADLDRHLTACPDCAAFSHYLLAEDQAIGRAMNAVPIPAGLKDKLHRGLNLKLAARRRRRVYQFAGIAATFLISIGLILGYRAATKPQLKTNDLVSLAEEIDSHPDETTRQWLADRGVPDTLPRPFDYNFLVFRGGENLQGRDVPVLVFFNPNTRQIAKIYICKDEQYANLKDTQEAQSSFFRTTILRIPGYSYVVLHNSPDLKPFLRNDQAA